MAPHLNCPACRIRVRADAPEIELLEGRCPACDATLRQALSAAGVVGFRLFDLDVLTREEPDSGPSSHETAGDLVAYRNAVSARGDAGRWPLDHGTITSAAATLPTPH
jgi:hypothetical protein